MTAAKTPRTQPSEVRRRDLLEAAATLFLQQGFDATPVDEIVLRAGMSKGLFYHYFSSKQEILAETGQSIGVFDAHLSIEAGEIFVVMGLSGSGKSLMVAKAAQQAALHYGVEYVAVVSYHDMRAGAWAQTQMLCAQLGVDCFRATNATTLKLLLEEHGQRKFIIIDTPGVQMSERLAEILQVCPEAGLHAVVPADSSAVTLSPASAIILRVE